MIIGYSFWGFLGNGVVDSPDGGRSHRLAWVRTLVGNGHRLIFLQRNRDLEEAGESYAEWGTWPADLPPIDLLFLEWRWPIPGRNVEVSPSSQGYCPDWDRQAALLRFYTLDRGIPTLVWDKDLQLPQRSPLRGLPHIRIAEATRFPRPGASSLLFPICGDWYRHAARELSKPAPDASFDLVYIGNQYDRDEHFERFFASAAPQLRHGVFGKWTRVTNWPAVRFHSRIGYEQVSSVLRTSVATPLLSPTRYCSAGQVTQRIFEAVLNGCFPLAPRDIIGIDTLLPDDLLVADGADVVRACKDLERLRRTPDYKPAILGCLSRLAPFLASAQYETFAQIVSSFGRRNDDIRH